MLGIPPRPRRLAVPLLVGLGGALGSALRWAAERAVPATPGHWPAATFATNVVGSFLLGVVLMVATAREAAGEGGSEGDDTDGSDPRNSLLRPFLGTGLLGGFTTWSTYAVQVRGLTDRSPTLALTYALGSVAAGVGAAWLGMAVARAAGFDDGLEATRDARHPSDRVDPSDPP